MKRVRRSLEMDDRQRTGSLRFTVLMALAFACCAMASPALLAHHVPGHHGSDIAECDCPPGVELVSQAWVRLLPPTQPNTAAYMTLRNLTDTDLHIVAAESPAARVTELHDHVQGAAGVMRMREVDAIVIPAHGAVELKPGGLHVMLIDLVDPLQEGRIVPITLYVEGVQDLHIRAPVQRAEGGPAHHHEHSHAHDHDTGHSHDANQ
jgi:copper(I)-binding protein